MLAYVLEHALDAGQASVKRGPELLPVLRESGVVDAGGYGLTVIFAGVIAALRGADPPPLEHHAPARITHPQHESSTYRYCTNFAVTGEDLEPSRWAQPLEELGDSVLVVGDAPHAEGPRPHGPPRARPRRCSTRPATVSRLDVADMHEQVPAAHGPARGRDLLLRRARRGLRRRDARALRGSRRGACWTAAPR